jgi:hypothetical protein
MTTPTSMCPSEGDIQNKLFNTFLINERKDSLLVKDWAGWSIRLDREHRAERFLTREFDIAWFFKEAGHLSLAGIEVKGWRSDVTGKMHRPPFGEGLDQALALLQMGADYAYVAYPEPADDELKEMCDHFAPNVGVYYVKNDLSSAYVFRDAQVNPHTTIAWKRIMLASLVAAGVWNEMSPMPDWVMNNDY